MRAREFVREVKRVPTVSLRHLHTLKKDERARQASYAKRDALLPIMYSNPAHEMARIELEKAYIELAQEQAELATTRAEANRESKEALARMAASEMGTRKSNQDKINKMAMRELGRRKKL
jgi:hypothetical protein